jgi:hypothetical protein
LQQRPGLLLLLLQQRDVQALWTLRLLLLRLLLCLLVLLLGLACEHH